MSKVLARPERELDRSNPNLNSSRLKSSLHHARCAQNEGQCGLCLVPVPLKIGDRPTNPPSFRRLISSHPILILNQLASFDVVETRL